MEDSARRITIVTMIIKIAIMVMKIKIIMINNHPEIMLISIMQIMMTCDKE